MTVGEKFKKLHIVKLRRLVLQLEYLTVVKVKKLCCVVEAGVDTARLGSVFIYCVCGFIDNISVSFLL